MERSDKIKVAREYIKIRRYEIEKQVEAIREIVNEGVDVVNRLINNRDAGIWGKDAATIALAANFRCEYCDKNLLESADTYKDFQIDHIEPLSKGGPNTNENSALSCRQCNINFKSTTSISQMIEYVDKWKKEQ